LIHTMAEGKIDNALEEVKNIMENKREDWVCHSQAIAATMSDRMEELGMTQRVLAEKMNCTQQYVSKVLKGRENLSLETLCKIENALGIKILQARINK
jgi:ribosome-binding protein aMBF1 (putative translation factor)